MHQHDYTVQLQMCYQIKGDATAMTTKIGVIAIRGDVEEHIIALEKTLAERQEIGEVVKIKHRGIVGSCDAIVIPGGESTTIGRLMEREGIFPEIKETAEKGKPILGTCAGMVLLNLNKLQVSSRFSMYSARWNLCLNCSACASHIALCNSQNFSLSGGVSMKLKNKSQ